jgi:hypothetical protein
LIAIIAGVVVARRLGLKVAPLPLLGWSAVGILGLAGIVVGFFGGVWGLVPGVPAVVLFAALALLTVRRGIGRGWFLPFAWILIVPAVTVPLHIGLLGVITDGYHYEGIFASGDAGACTQVNQLKYDKLWHCPLEAAAPTLLPGLLNLAPLLFLFSSARRARYAGLVAGSLGAVRLIVPALIYAADAPDVEIIGSYQWPPAMGSLASVYASVALWMVSLAAAVVIAPRFRPAAEAQASSEVG